MDWRFFWKQYGYLQQKKLCTYLHYSCIVGIGHGKNHPQPIVVHAEIHVVELSGVKLGQLGVVGG